MEKLLKLSIKGSFGFSGRKEMAERKEIKFGTENDYDYDYKKPPEENWENMREHYLKRKGLDIGEFPIMTAEEEAELAKQLEELK